MKINFYKALRAIGQATDLISPALTSHHERTAFITHMISKTACLPREVCRRAYIAALVHDIGGVSLQQRLTPLEYDSNIGDDDIEFISHITNGANFLKEIPILSDISDIVLHHHHEWNYGLDNNIGEKEVPLESHILFLADRIDTLVACSNSLDLLKKSQKLREIIARDSDKRFNPRLVDAFMEVSSHEYFWLVLEAALKGQTPDYESEISYELITLTDFSHISKLIAVVVDSHSSFTAEHSRRVAVLSKQIAHKVGLDEETCQMLEVAGYLHDIGKLAVPTTILDKPGILTSDEMNHIRRHSYMTREILKNIDGLGSIVDWAANHHERADGRGYPYGYEKKDLSPKGKIIALADVYVALTEDRPYRSGMLSSDAIKIIKSDFQDSNDVFSRALEDIAFNKKVYTIL